MHKTIFIYILTVFFYTKGNSQFLVWPKEQQRADVYHTLLPQTKNNIFQFLVLRDNNSLTPYRERHQILSYDLSGNFIDSVNLPKGFVPISFPVKKDNFYYWSSLYIDTTVSYPNNQDAFLLKFDTLFNCVIKKRVGKNANTTEFTSNVIEIKNKLYLAVRNTINNNFALYKLDTQLNKVDSMFLPGWYIVSELQKTNDDKIMIAGDGFSALSSPGSEKVIIDTALNIISVFKLDSLTNVTVGSSATTGCSSQISVSPVNFKIQQITSTKNFITGSTPVIYDSVCNIRQSIIHSVLDNNKVINTVIISDSLREIRYADITNFTFFDNRYMFTVASEGYNGWFTSNNNTSILVTKSDTMGNLVWKKRYGDDMFYRPASIIQTLDSGFLISGIRYDYQNTSYNGVGQGFILRLDKNGGMISTGIIEKATENYSVFKIYPNPSKDYICIDVPFANDYDVNIYDVYGKLVISHTKYKNSVPINTIELCSGVYVFRIKTNHVLLSGKLIKQ